MLFSWDGEETCFSVLALMLITVYLDAVPICPSEHVMADGSYQCEYSFLMEGDGIVR